jgi:hypothetical protein
MFRTLLLFRTQDVQDTGHSFIQDTSYVQGTSKFSLLFRTPYVHMFRTPYVQNTSYVHDTSGHLMSRTLLLFRTPTTTDVPEGI